MRPPFDDLDEFAFNDSAAVNRILREQRKEERRFASRKPHDSPGDDENLDDMDYDDYEDYGDYNEDEFDEYSDSDH
ncbi:MAG TPA: hypothetical protein VFY03_06085 [Woeseiaceae bacterium]|nr:hypothetical protein [Woeseiaceae bacterium]